MERIRVEVFSMEIMQKLFSTQRQYNNMSRWLPTHIIILFYTKWTLLRLSERNLLNAFKYLISGLISWPIVLVIKVPILNFCKTIKYFLFYSSYTHVPVCTPTFVNDEWMIGSRYDTTTSRIITRKKSQGKWNSSIIKISAEIVTSW